MRTVSAPQATSQPPQAVRLRLAARVGRLQASAAQVAHDVALLAWRVQLAQEQRPPAARAREVAIGMPVWLESAHG